MKRKGFTLIKLVVVIALIAILAVTLAPRLRDQIAKAGDAKAVAVLGSLRTQSEVYFADNQETAIVGEGSIDAALDELIANLDNSAQKLIDEASAARFVPVGGTSTTNTSGDVIYGGEITFTFGEDGGTYSATSDDGISLWFNSTASPGTGSGSPQFDTKGTAWASY